MFKQQANDDKKAKPVFSKVEDCPAVIAARQKFKELQGQNEAAEKNLNDFIRKNPLEKRTLAGKLRFEKMSDEFFEMQDAISAQAGTIETEIRQAQKEIFASRRDEYSAAAGRISKAIGELLTAFEAERILLGELSASGCPDLPAGWVFHERCNFGGFTFCDKLTVIKKFIDQTQIS